MLSIAVVDLYTCSCYSEVDGNFIYSPKLASACLQCTLGHCAVGSVTSGMELVIEVLQLAGTKWHFLPLFFW